MRSGRGSRDGAYGPVPAPVILAPPPVPRTEFLRKPVTPLSSSRSTQSGAESRTDLAAPRGHSGEPLALTQEERLALAGREPSALERFYEVFFDRVYGYVRRLLRDEHLAEDVTQDIFMHIHRSLPSYDPTRELRPWVFTIATNKVRDFWRSRRYRDSQRELSAEDDEGGSFAVSPPISPHRGPVDQLASGELSEQVAEAIAELPEIMRTTLVLRYYEGLSFAEIGRLVERNETAVRKRYSRALEELRRRLDKVLARDDKDPDR